MDMMDGSGTTETSRAAEASRAARGGLAEIGTMLRGRREQVGQDLTVISAATHIRVHYLKAIEEGRRKELPGTAYMIGYIRTYADYLGFDGNRLITDYHDVLTEQHKWVDKRAEPVQAAGGLPQFQISPVILMAGLVILGIAGYVAWGYATAPKEEGTIEAAEVEAPAEEVTPDTPPVVTPAPPPPTIPSPTGANASAPTDTPIEAAPAPAPEPPAAEAEDQVPPEAEVASTGEEVGAGEEVVDQSPPQSETAAAASEDPAGKIVVRARLESWIQITNAKQEVVFSRVLRAGETYTVPDEEGLLFTTGNAGGVEIMVDGTKLKSLGTVGLVKRDIPLDAQKLKDGSAFKTSRAAPATN
jgi:cytoskeleton protein RodZ